jgi:inner membrane protein involved in colicin E2 resistance
MAFGKKAMLRLLLVVLVLLLLPPLPLLPQLTRTKARATRNTGTSVRNSFFICELLQAFF